MIVGFLETFELSFNCEGHADVEPRFANIVELEKNEEK